MDLSFDDDQAAIRESFATFFRRESSPEVVRASEPVGFDAALWQRLIALSASAMGIDATSVSGTSMDQVIIAEEMGRAIAPVPLIETTVAARVFRELGETCTLQDMSDGTILSTVSLRPPRKDIVRLIPAGAIADVVIVFDGEHLIAVRRPGGIRPPATPPANLGCSPVGDWDISDPSLERKVLASGDRARAVYEDSLALWKLLMSAALNGIRRAALELGVEYVKHRKAFGVPIGSFQAVQHRLADLVVAGDGAELLVYEAAWAMDSGSKESQRLASMAFLFSSETAFRTCRESLQFHGGYGFTSEYDIQLYFRRARAWPLALGDSRLEYRRLSQFLYPTEVRDES